ncbi:MAG: GspH/FimT family pseudopilin [Algisphaera sp.]
MKPRCRPFATAYTLIEVLVVVVILGILGGIVVPNMLTAGEMGVQAAARTVVADLLVAQNEAVAAQAQRTMVFDTANNRYALFDENGAIVRSSWMKFTTDTMDLAGNDVTSPSGRYFMVDFDKDNRYKGVQFISSNFAGSNTVVFDDLGAPLSGGRVVIQFGDKAFRIDVGSFTGRLTVAPN